MQFRTIPKMPSIGLRAAVLVPATILVVVMAIAVSVNVSDHVRQAAVNEAQRSTEAVVLGYMGTTLLPEALREPTGSAARQVNGRLEELTGAGQILRIKVWSHEGTILFSDLAALRGRSFEVEDDLAEALDGESVHEFSDGSAAENVLEAGLADRFLSLYLPIGDGSGATVGAYEIYEDAAPIEAAVDAVRRDVLLIVGVASLALLVLLYLAFAGSSKLLALQNRRLRDQALSEQLLATDLRRSDERFRSLVRNSVDVNMILDATGTVTFESPAVERVLGYRAEDRIGRPALDIVHPDDRAHLGRLFVTVSHTPGAEASAELRVRHEDGSWRSVEAVLKNLLDDPAVRGVIANYRDVTARKELEDELRLRAFHDALTGLANRALFTDRLEHALERTRRSPNPLAVLFLDLDDFKTINDSLGHGEGDNVLTSVAERLRHAVRAGDTLARLGGDEFAVLIEDSIDPTPPIEVAERLLETLRAPFQHAAGELFVHASVGVAVVAGGRSSADELLRDADAAMYTAKGRGKNRAVVFESGMHRAAVARLELKGDLERALDHGQFVLAYQPIVELRTGTIEGVEALLRWNHPSGRVVAPGDFIALAEETGLIVPLGGWILETACRDARRWDASGGHPALSVNVNVSGRQVSEPGFIDEVANALTHSGLGPNRLILEFTENVLIEDSDQSAATLASLKSLGVRLAIDDFGTGFSSLGYLRRFPIDVLKIDGSFIASLSGGREQREVVSAILRLGETLHLETVAEGVETELQVSALTLLGATRAQGFFFGRPATPDAITTLLAAQRSGSNAAAGGRRVA
jgi:diguanylate cyclase (GGDEF)-like protein/PAS domain S-box-containing protein